MNYRFNLYRMLEDFEKASENPDFTSEYYHTLEI